MPQTPLPIDAVLPELLAKLREHGNAVLKAPTGAGKTTRVPPAILDAGLAGSGQVVMLEPRRIAARAAARRIAEERGGRVGDEVGFQVRFERVASASTRILVLTEGLLVRRLLDDPFLDGVGAIVFDEFHERNVDSDVALALVRRVQREVRPDLRIVAMSATIGTAELARFLGDAPIVVSEGRLHPVEVRWMDDDEDAPIAPRVVRGVGRALESTAGDVLAFLPGVGEIKRVRQDLEALAARRDLALHELYGDLAPDEQDAALRKGTRRKVVLATNVAETSVTIDGVTAVVDSGLARKMRYDAGAALDRLELVRISRASAAQRTGRAGRTAPGVCFRLWSERTERALDESEEPEIRRIDLAGVVLQLHGFGESDAIAFPWFDPPSRAAIERAEELLTRLGALRAGALTEIGKSLLRIPAHPRLARLLLEGHRRGVPSSTCVAAALLQERDPFQRAPRGSRARTSDSDVVDRVRALERFEESGSTWSPAGEVAPGAARFVLRAADGLFRDVERAFGTSNATSANHDEALMRAVLAAYPDRVARRREAGSKKAVMIGGRGVVLAEDSGVIEHELFVAVEVDAGARGERADALVRNASAVEREWLEPSLVRTETALAFDRERERVIATRRTCFDDLVLDEVQTQLPDAERVGAMLARAAADDLERALPLAEKETSAFLARVRSLRAWVPELELPEFTRDELAALLPEYCAGSKSFDELRRGDLVAFLGSKLTHDQRRALERDAPEKLQVPSGSLVRLDYEPGKAPVLAVRIQEVFGLASTPRIARNRVRVLMHLLSPNYRPQQITEDLESFWNGAYHEVKKELKRRYPRHSWPDDPWNAPAERRPKRRT